MAIAASKSTPPAGGPSSSLLSDGGLGMGDGDTTSADPSASQATYTSRNIAMVWVHDLSARFLVPAHVFSSDGLSRQE